MERGETNLHEVLRNGKMPEGIHFNYWDMLRQVVDGLSYLEDKQIVHHDLKRENLLLCKDGTIKLFDFGFSARVGEPTGKATILFQAYNTDMGNISECISDMYALGYEIDATIDLVKNEYFSLEHFCVNGLNKKDVMDLMKGMSKILTVRKKDRIHVKKLQEMIKDGAQPEDFTGFSTWDRPRNRMANLFNKAFNVN